MRTCLLAAMLMWFGTQFGFAEVRKYAVHIQDAHTGEALPYVNVYVSPQLGTLTNLDGNFDIEVDEEAVLKISCIGYEKILIKASQLTGIVRMKPLEYTLQEVSAIPVEWILKKTADKLYKEYRKKRGKESHYFYRLTTSHPGRRELVEAFTTARSAGNLRGLTFVNGRRGRVTGTQLSTSGFSSANLHHIIELGPAIHDAPFWDFLIQPLRVAGDAKQFNQLYDYTCKRTTGPGGQEILCIELAPKLAGYSFLSGSSMWTPGNTPCCDSTAMCKA